MNKELDEDSFAFFEFAGFLVEQVTGKSVAKMSEEKALRSIYDCLQVYENYVIDYFKINFTEIDSKIIEKGFKEGLEVIKTEDLLLKFNKANQSFFKLTKTK